MEHGVSPGARGHDRRTGRSGPAIEMPGEPQPSLSAASVTELVLCLREAWRQSDAIWSLVCDPSLLSRPLAQRPALIQEFVHPAAVAHELVCCQALGEPALEQELLARLGQAAEEPSSEVSRPSVSEVRSSRDRLREALITAAPRCGADTTPLRRALRHEWHHQELLLTMIWALEPGQKRAPARRQAPHFGSAASRRKVSIPAGFAPCSSGLVAVEAFEIDSTPVMNGEFYEFVLAGGYDDRRHWSVDGWSWRCDAGRSHPASWRRVNGAWCWRGLFEDLPLTRVFDWPVIVGLAEARAFLSWRGQRLPGEGEYCRAAFSTRDGGQRLHPWGDSPPDVDKANLGQWRDSPVPVGSLAAGASDWGVLDLLGNGWEWTKAPAGATKDGCQALLLGASWATAAGLLDRRCRQVVSSQGDGWFSKFRGVSQA